MSIHVFELRVRNAANQITSDIELDVTAHNSREARDDLARGIEWAVQMAQNGATVQVPAKATEPEQQRERWGLWCRDGAGYWSMVHGDEVGQRWPENSQWERAVFASEAEARAGLARRGDPDGEFYSSRPLEEPQPENPQSKEPSPKADIVPAYNNMIRRWQTLYGEELNRRVALQRENELLKAENDLLRDRLRRAL